MKKCMHCKKDNKEGWFYCKSCGKRASESKFTTNMYMMSDMGKRTDVEFSSQSINKNADEMRRRIHG